jgi:hypothetical protein
VRDRQQRFWTVHEGQKKCPGISGGVLAPGRRCRGGGGVHRHGIIAPRTRYSRPSTCCCPNVVLVEHAASMVPEASLGHLCRILRSHLSWNVRSHPLLAALTPSLQSETIRLYQKDAGRPRRNDMRDCPALSGAVYRCMFSQLALAPIRYSTYQPSGCLIQGFHYFLVYNCTTKLIARIAYKMNFRFAHCVSHCHELTSSHTLAFDVATRCCAPATTSAETEAQPSRTQHVQKPRQLASPQAHVDRSN